MSESVVGVIHGGEMSASFQELLKITGFDGKLLDACQTSGRSLQDFRVVIKPNMMVYIADKGHEATVTDKNLVEALVDHIRALGFTNVAVCEAQHDVGRMLKNHNVAFVAEHIGYRPDGRYRIVDLTKEATPYSYEYEDAKGDEKVWKDVVGLTWRDADFRISFAKCKTHEHDWMTLAVKNIYGCFPSPNKISKYHIRNEVFDVTARSLRNFPVHFALVDGWIASDGFQGYKIPHPRNLQMLFGGDDPIAVDMEIFKRAGLEPLNSRILRNAVQQVHGGVYPTYNVSGDQVTSFSDICDWENIADDVVRAIDRLEEVYIAWALINLKPTAEVVDFNLFPPKNFMYRFLVWFSHQLNALFKLTRFYRRLYSGRAKAN